MDGILKIHFFIAFAGVWMLGNGILHDVFVLRESRPFERDLIRLLIDGHILIFSGTLYLICYNGLKANQSWAFAVSLAIAFFLLGYCALIFKMLPSLGTILINTMALAWLIVTYPKSDFSVTSLNINSKKGMVSDHISAKVVRISIAYFKPEQTEKVASKLADAEKSLRPAIQKLNGNIGYYVAIDKEKHSMTNISLWQSLSDAQQMNALKEMQQLRVEFESLGVEFVPITNHEVLWAIREQK